MNVTMNKDNEYKGESFTIEFPRIFIPPVHSLKSSFYYYKMQNGTKVCAISLFQQVPVSVVFLFFFPPPPSLWEVNGRRALHSDREIFRLYLVIKTSRSKNYLRAACGFQRHRRY